MTLLQISDHFATSNANLEHQQINLIAGQNCLYFKVSQRENAVPEQEQIVPLQEGTALI